MRSLKNVPEQLKLADFADKSLLILDDDDPLRGRLARAMEKKGFQVKEAKSVAEGLNIAKTAPTAFAVIDLRLDDGNGLDVVRELSKNNPAPDCYQVKRNADIQPVNLKRPCFFGHSYESYRRTCDIEKGVKVFDYAAEKTNAAQYYPSMSQAKKQVPGFSQSKAK